MKKIKFWIPIMGGFLIIPGEKNYLDGDFFPNNYIFLLFLMWHISWMILPFILF